MEIAIQLVWWIGLIGALILTLVILHEVMLVLRALKDIHKLAQYTRQAARGTADNMAAASKLSDLDNPARELHEATSALASAAAGIEQKLDSLTAGFSRAGG